MPATGLPQLSAAQVVGRYFTVVSFIPSVVFVTYVMLLVNSGAWGGNEVSFSSAIGSANLKDLAVLGVTSLLLALALNPIQVSLIQAFEGFWGLSWPGARFALMNTMRHRRRAHDLFATAVRAHSRAHPPEDEEHPGQDRPPFAADPDAARPSVSDLLRSNEAWRLYGDYPHQFEHVMPTRLGNVLRKYEVIVGAFYGVDCIASVPRLMQVADARDVAYVQNQRTQLELALRTSVLALAAAAITVAFMWRHGAWLLLALVPYAVAFATYRGSVVIAREYGTSLAVLVELNRFALYERMRLTSPPTLRAERTMNRRLMNFFRMDNTDIEKRLREVDGVPVFYSHPTHANKRISGDGTSAE